MTLPLIRNMDADELAADEARISIEIASLERSIELNIKFGSETTALETLEGFVDFQLWLFEKGQQARQRLMAGHNHTAALFNQCPCVYCSRVKANG